MSELNRPEDYEQVLREIAHAPITLQQARDKGAALGQVAGAQLKARLKELNRTEDPFLRTVEELFWGLTSHGDGRLASAANGALDALRAVLRA